MMLKDFSKIFAFRCSKIECSARSLQRERERERERELETHLIYIAPETIFSYFGYLCCSKMNGIIPSCVLNPIKVMPM